MQYSRQSADIALPHCKVQVSVRGSTGCQITFGNKKVEPSNFVLILTVGSRLP